MANLVGKTIGKYTITDFLGRGGMAEVYKAYHPKLDRYVTIKILHTFLAEGEDFRSRFDREAKAVASLRHPHIVQIYDFDYEDSNYYMVMEFIGGGTLQSHMLELSKSSKYMPINQVLSIIKQIADALDYAHKKGIIHRDIKPSNILLDTNGDAYLADFGIARIMSETQLTATGSLIGTPTYMSPEQGMGADLTAMSDLYSLGVILFELLTGKVPFTSQTTPLAIIHKHINEPPPNPQNLRPDLTEAVEQVVRKALAKAPMDRYQSGGELFRDLEKTLPPEMIEKLNSFNATAVVTILSPPTKPFELPEPDADQAKLPIIAIEEGTSTEIPTPSPIKTESFKATRLPACTRPIPEIPKKHRKSNSDRGREGWGWVNKMISSLKIQGRRNKHSRSGSPRYLPETRIINWWIIGIVLVGIMVVVGALLIPGTLSFIGTQIPGIMRDGYVYFSSDKNGKTEIWMMNQNGQIFQVTHTPVPYKSWSPVLAVDGNLYFTSDNNGKAEIWMMDQKGKIFQVTHTPDPYESWSPALTADGYLYFTSDNNGKTEIWMMDQKGQVFQVTHTPDSFESWSPAPAANGNVYFTSNINGKAEVWMIDPKGQITQVINISDPYESWSPAPALNGYLYFTSDNNGKSEIWMRDQAGQIFQVTHTQDTYESWSPAPAVNGNVYFTSNNNGKAEVWMINPKGQLFQVINISDTYESWVFYFDKPQPNPKR